MLHITDQIAHSTVRIEAFDLNGAEIGTGTGFFWAFPRDGNLTTPMLLTNKHVLNGATSARIHITRADEHGNPAYGKHDSLMIDDLRYTRLDHPDNEVDLCGIFVGSHLSNINHKIFFRTLDETLLLTTEDIKQLGAVEDILMVGYPNGIWDSLNNMPVFRRGITATHPALDLDGKQVFLIDAACFPGSSGSPVFLYNPNGYVENNGNVILGGVRLKFLGVLFQGPMRQIIGNVTVIDEQLGAKTIAVSNIPMNLGHVIKSSRISEMSAEVRRITGFPRQTS